MEKKSPNILKLNWERRTPPANLSQKEIERAVAVYTSQRITSVEPFSNGCANSNYKISLSDGMKIVLRAYTRDPESLDREHKIHKLIQDKVPVPLFFHTCHDTTNFTHPIAIIEYVEGILFRDLILKDNQEAIESCGYQAGEILTQIASNHFENAGFFENDLTVKPFGKDQDFFTFIHSFLSGQNIIDWLGKDMIKDLHACVEKHHLVLTEMSNHKNLTHADYDPSNILVKCENKEWRISAILDWEFAFSSTTYMDIGLMVRFAHKLPSYFQAAFIQGLKNTNPSLLDEDWETRAKLMDIVCLLSLCASNPFHIRPVMFEDVKGLLRNTCQFLKEKHNKYAN